MAMKTKSITTLIRMPRESLIASSVRVSKQHSDNVGLNNTKENYFCAVGKKVVDKLKSNVKLTPRKRGCIAANQIEICRRDGLIKE